MVDDGMWRVLRRPVGDGRETSVGARVFIPVREQGLSAKGLAILRARAMAARRTAQSTAVPPEPATGYPSSVRRCWAGGNPRPEFSKNSRHPNRQLCAPRRRSALAASRSQPRSVAHASAHPRTAGHPAQPLRPAYGPRRARPSRANPRPSLETTIRSHRQQSNTACASEPVPALRDTWRTQARSCHDGCGAQRRARCTTRDRHSAHPSRDRTPTLVPPPCRIATRGVCRMQTHATEC